MVAGVGDDDDDELSQNHQQSHCSDHSESQLCESSVALVSPLEGVEPGDVTRPGATCVQCGREPTEAANAKGYGSLPFAQCGLGQDP